MTERGEATESGNTDGRPTETLAQQPAGSRDLFVVAIGASAGGLASLEAFFENVSDDSGLAYVLIQHLSPNYKSLMGEILTRHTKLPIRTVTSGLRIEPDHVYIIPEQHNIEVDGGAFRLIERDSAAKPNHPIDVFFGSLAREFGPRAIAVVLSGTGTDGTQGIHAIKQAGGAVLVQDDTAQFDGMPKSAISSGLADLILPPENMPRQIVDYTELSAFELAPDENPKSASVIEMVLHRAKQHTGLDFTQYRTSTIARRIEKRMRFNRLENIEDYYRLVESSDKEAKLLVRELMIGVTSFFRDPDAFDALRTKVFPELIENSGADDLIRVWVAGCATGEEAYSLAICLAEATKGQDTECDFKVFATDLNQTALQTAAAGLYTPTIQSQMPEKILQRYFNQEGDGFRIARRIRDRMVFARHDITKDAPFTRMDIVSCRNVLIYQRDELQDQVLGLFSFALRPGRFLFLGSSETLARHRDEFDTIDSRWRIFRKRKVAKAQHPVRFFNPASPPRPLSSSLRDQRYLTAAAAALLEEKADAAVIIDSRQAVLQSLGDIGGFLQVPEGSPTRNLTKMLRGSLRISVPNLIRRLMGDEVNDGHHTERIRLRESDDDEFATQVTVRRVNLRTDEEPILIVFLKRDALDPKLEPVATIGVEHELNEAHISSLEQELSETREHLQTTIEELESANEELQSANEELVASNEELQSTNEELHSVNEELHTVNAEYQRKLDEQRLLSTDMQNLLDISEVGTVFLDRQLRVRKFTPAVTRVVPLLTQDIGRPIEHIRHGLIDCDLIDIVRRVFASEVGDEQEVANADGRWLLLRTVPYRDQEDQCSGVVVNFVDVTAMRVARQSLAESEERFRQIAEHIGEAFWVRATEDGSLEYLSPAWETIWGRKREELGGDTDAWCASIHEDDRPDVEKAYGEMLDSGDLDLEYRVKRPDGEIRWVRDRGFPIHDEDDRVVRIAGICEDVTPQKMTEVALREAAATMDDLASRDALTGLQNRRGLEKILSAENTRHQRFGGRLMAILIDCDDFKSVNDTFGHAAGDVVLREICTRMQRVTRPNDVLARIGGDEFLALLPDTRRGEAFRVAERLRVAITESALRVGDRTLNVTASLGVGAVSPDLLSLEEIIQEIQGALAQSKRAGKNCVAGVDETDTSSGNVLSALRSGHGFRVFSQFIRKLEDGEVIGCELLSRGPIGILENPNDFFRFSVENDMLTAVDLKCLKNCLGAIRHLPDPLPAQVHVNLYPSSLLDLDLKQLQAWTEPLMQNTQLCVELSEQQFIGDPTHLRDRVTTLKSWGVHIAIDDVGFGRSSLESLIVLQPDVIKIDRIYVHEVSKDKQRRQNLERLLGVSRSLSADVVAEGIEESEDLAILVDLGVGSGQGYLWDRPQPVSAN